MSKTLQATIKNHKEDREEAATVTITTEISLDVAVAPVLREFHCILALKAGRTNFHKENPIIMTPKWPIRKDLIKFCEG